ncbi:glycosyltransferase [bacterium]|nr:MAG: glycosyltransferase [bacterium]
MFQDKRKFKVADPDVRPGHDTPDWEGAARRARGRRAQFASGGARTSIPFPGEVRRLLFLIPLGLVFLALYALGVGFALFRPGYSPIDRVASAFLGVALLFVLLHGLGYANSMLKAFAASRNPAKILFAPANSPRVTCLIASYNEPPEVLEETVAAVSALDYPNKEIILLDDSTHEGPRRAAREIAAKYDVRCVQRVTRRGFKAGAINDFLPEITSPYIAMFDADALPTPEFLREVVPHLIENPRLGWAQTPQFYANTNVSYTALAAARQQSVFYEYICEGKSYSRAAFCCGTNVIFARRALEDVGGFDESSVTEDFATSLKLHLRGWDSLYLNRVYVYSLAPETLGAYFTQQSRWAFGSLGLLRPLLARFFKNPRGLKAGQWFEYLLSTTYYWIGLVNFIFLMLPILYIFFGIKPLRLDALTYLAVFLPYLAFSLHTFYAGMEARGLKVGDMMLGQQLGFLSFPTHIAAGLSALSGRKRPFGVTPKGVGGRVSYWSLWPQLLMLALSAGACGWGMYRYFAGLDRNTTAALVNSFWALYHVWMLSSVFRLNRPVRVGESKKILFARDGEEEVRTLSALEGARNPLSLGRVTAALAVACLLFIGTFIGIVASWNRAPVYPVNVMVLDRTGAQNGREHRQLLWTLNYLKVRQQKGGVVNGARPTYDLDRDYFGAFYAPNARPALDAKTGELVVTGVSRPLPPRLPSPGLLYIADTFGEFRVRDARAGKLVTYRARKRGLTATEVEAIDDFARRGGMVMGEWNALGFPTRPGGYLPEDQLKRAIETARQNRIRLERTELARAQTALDVAQSSHDFRRISAARGRLEDVRGEIVTAEYRLRALQNRSLYNAVQAKQARAAQQLEGLLHTSYAGWYGRFVDDFAAEASYDPELYRSVAADLKRRLGDKARVPSGPGFVFYPDGGSETINPQTGAIEKSPFARPVVILGSDLGGAANAELCQIVRTRDEKLRNDPLLRGVREAVPARLWFDLVRPKAGARVLANYELRITPQTAERLRKAGFPKEFLADSDSRVRFPALVAFRDGNTERGELRSVYFAGDASGYPSIDETVQRFPALGAAERWSAGRLGTFGTQFFWGYYEPVLRNVFEENPRLRYSS